MPLNPRGLYRLKLIGELHGQETETTFHFKTKESSIVTTYLAEMQATLNDFEISVLPKILAWASDDFHVKSILAVTLIPRPGWLIEKRLAGGEGFQGGDSLPAFCAGLLSLRTGFAGRSGHGRLFLPGVPEDLQSESRLEGVSLGQLSDIGNTLVNRYGVSGSFASTQLGVFSRKLGASPSTVEPGTIDYNINGFMTLREVVARPEIATVRKRKLGHGK